MPKSKRSRTNYKCKTLMMMLILIKAKTKMAVRLTVKPMKLSRKATFKKNKNNNQWRLLINQMSKMS